MDIEKMINEYITWLKSEISISKVGEYYEITSPFLDRNNDYMQVYIKQNNENFVLTDDGYTIGNLKSEGISFTPARSKLLSAIIKRYGVKSNGSELSINTTFDNFPHRKHMLLQAMLSVDDMFMTAQSRIASFFLEDVERYFAEHEIYTAENVQFTGISGFTHTYDYLLPRSRTKPERLCRALNRPTKSNVTNVLFGWEDTKSTRKSDSTLLVIVNDEKNIAQGVLESLENYKANIVMWSKREETATLEFEGFA